MNELEQQRRFFAEEIQVVANLRSPALVEAFASVPRERFLPPGPWLIRGEADFGREARRTPDDEPRHVYHNVAIAIDAARQLFNGGPSVLASWIDAIGIGPDARVLHVGCGTGYFSAVMAHCVGARGRVVAVEIDEPLAVQAGANLAGLPSVEVRLGDGTSLGREMFDAILVNAGTTHPHEAWLAALAPGGRLLVPLTCTMPQMGAIGKGIVVLMARPDSPCDPTEFTARSMGMVAIYSAAGIRDDAMNRQLGKALAAKGMFPSLTRLRREPHEVAPSCWLHGSGWCLSGPAA